MSQIGVVIPTKNSIAYLPRHLAALHQWSDLAGEIVVVDSLSTDGTVDFLKTNLRHPHVRFVSHPPGLYQSWNHGLQQIRSKYAYVATVGDTITRAGMVRIAVFDVNGRIVQTPLAAWVSPGRHAIPIHARGAMAAGVYFYRLQAAEGVRSGRIVIVD